MRLTIIAAICCSATLHAQITGARIALRLGGDEVLIVGDELKAGPRGMYLPYMDKLPKAEGASPFQPIEDIFRAAAPGQTAPIAQTGDRWLLYTGSGGAAPVVVDSPAFGYYCGGLGGYSAALARFTSPEEVNRVEGLRSGAFLASPAAGLGTVSSQPLVPVDLLREPGVDAALALTMAQWETKVNGGNSDWVRGLGYKGRVLRWRAPGRTPLLLVEAVWSDGKRNPRYGATAIIEEGGFTVLDFNPKIGDLMRVPETLAEGGWNRPESGTFLNAWAIGPRRFMLRYTRYYEGFQVELMELLPGKGLVSTPLHFGAGC